MTQIAVVLNHDSSVPAVYRFDDSAPEADIIEFILRNVNARLISSIEICTLQSTHKNEPTLSVWLKNTKRLTK